MTESKVCKIVSGGQTGADQAGLDAARSLGIAHGGWVPKGRKTEDGPLSMLYDMQETDSEDYRVRTKRNVLDSDGTLIASHGALTGGSLLTQNLAVGYGKPCMHIDFSRTSKNKALEDLRRWLLQNGIQVLNVAGPRRSMDPGIYTTVKEILAKALSSAYPK